MQVKDFLELNQLPFIPESGDRELRIVCPYCHNEKQKCYVNASSGNWYCFHCGYGGLFKNLAEKLKLDTRGVSLELHEDKTEWDIVSPIDPEDVDEHHQRLLKALETDQGIQEYIFTKRGYNMDTVKKFKLGWGKGANIIIPITDSNGVCYNFKLKSDPTRPVPAKGMYSIEGRGKKRLFNEKVLTAKTKKDTERVIICEGEWDCMLLDQMGYPAVTSTGGVQSFDESWIPAFNKFTKVYLCFDNDRNNAGQQGIKKTAEMFHSKGIRVFIVNLPSPLVTEDKVDVTDFFTKRKKTKADFTELLKSAQEFSGDVLPAEKYSFISLSDLVDKEFPKQNWIVEHFIPEEGLSCIAGPPGVYKSYFTNYIAGCIAQGIPVLDKFKTQRVPVLFIDKENSLRRIRERIIQMNVPKEHLQNIHLMDSANFSVEDKQSIEQVKRAIIDYGVKLVVLDTLVRMHSGDEASAKDMNLIKQVMWEFQKLGAAVLFIHHFKKLGNFYGSNVDVVDALRGSGDIYAMLDTYFAMQNKDHVIRIDMAKNRDEAIMKPFNIDISFWEEGSVTFKYLSEIDFAEEQQYATIPVKTAITDYLKRGTVKREEIITALGNLYSRPSIDRALSELKKLEKVFVTGNTRDRKYFLPPDAFKAQVDIDFPDRDDL